MDIEEGRKKKRKRKRREGERWIKRKIERNR
jgi:hypothetical protein